MTAAVSAHSREDAGRVAMVEILLVGVFRRPRRRSPTASMALIADVTLARPLRRNSRRTGHFDVRIVISSWSASALGVSARWTMASRMSSTIATTPMTIAAPEHLALVDLRACPSWMRLPSVSLPRNDAIVAVANVCRVELRTPAAISGSASGSSTRRRI